MKYFLFTNVVGSFIFDENYSLIEKGDEKKLLNKYNPEKLAKEDTKKILGNFKRSDNYSIFRNKNLLLTKKKIKDSVKEDLLIIQAIDSINDLTKVIDSLIKRLREWYELYSPEVSREVEDHEKFVELILKHDKSDLMNSLKIDHNNTMGGDLSNEDIKAIKELAKKLESLIKLRHEQEDYLDKLVKRCCPNVAAIAGSLISAKLITHAGSLLRLSEMPSSTIQLLGAEKALFRHMKTGARSPKHGLIVQHTYFMKAKSKDYGKIARLLADKISIAAKVDYFKGSPIGEKLKRQIEAKIYLMTGK